MIASRASAVRPVAAVVLAAAFLGTAAASLPGECLAQDGPRRLVPVQRAPATSMPSAAAAPAGYGRTTSRRAIKKGFEVDKLESIDPDSVGTLGAADGGLGDAMWRGTPRAVAEALIDRLPDNPHSPVMHDLMRRLLLSRAAVPEGEATGDPLVVRRARKLAALGDMAGLKALIGAVQRRDRPQQLSRYETEVHLADYQLPLACKLAGIEIERDQDAYWNKLFVFCQALAGQKEKAVLGLSLLRETGDSDAAYEVLVEAVMQGKPAKLETLEAPTLLHVAMARVTKTELPASSLDAAGPGVLSAIAGAKRLPLTLRIDAAERAMASGATSADIVDRLYGEVAFTQAEQANPLSQAEAAEDKARSRALLYLTAFNARMPVVRAEVVAKALDLGRQAERYEIVARTFGPVLTAVTPSQELLWFAPRAVRALLSAGGAEAARRWYTLLRRSASRQAESMTAASRLAPAVAVALGEVDGAGPQSMERWWRAAQGDPTAVAAASYLAGIYLALDLPLPDGFLERLPARATASAAAPMPPTALWFRLLRLAEDLENAKDQPMAMAQGETLGVLALSRAGGRVAIAGLSDTSVAPPPSPSDVKGQRRAEAVALVLTAFAEHGPGGVHPATLHAALRTLRAVGLNGAAQAIALEAVLGHGL